MKAGRMVFLRVRIVGDLHAARVVQGGAGACAGRMPCSSGPLLLSRWRPGAIPGLIHRCPGRGHGSTTVPTSVPSVSRPRPGWWRRLCPGLCPGMFEGIVLGFKGEIKSLRNGVSSPGVGRTSVPLAWRNEAKLAVPLPPPRPRKFVIFGAPCSGEEAQKWGRHARRNIDGS